MFNKVIPLPATSNCIISDIHDLWALTGTTVFLGIEIDVMHPPE
jgi:hypothetical protein